MTRAELIRNAGEKLTSARLLAGAGCWPSAYYLGGYAVEMSLKAVIAGTFRAGEIPDRKLVDSIHTHNLARLVEIAGLGADLDAWRLRTPFAERWLIVLSWSEAARYRWVGPADGRPMLDALDHPEHGIMAWLATHLPELRSTLANDS